MTKSGGPRRKFIDNIGTVSLALVLAVVIWVYAMYQNDRPQTAWFPEAIPIEVVNAPSGLEVVNNPAQSARVQIKAFASSWNSLTASSFRATVDWRNLKRARILCRSRSLLPTAPSRLSARSPKPSTSS